MTPWLVIAGLFYTLRRLEVWLHQHIFKVGWLVTKQYQTTTILYYAFFLPGILINQVIYWAAAGFLNVRAERSIVWPEKQEIGELKLSFVRIAKDAGPLRLAAIASAPLVAGMLAVWHIAVNVLAIPAKLNTVQNGLQGDLSANLAYLTSAPDFWLWLYLAFTISNTMMPNFALLRGWRVIILAMGIIVAALFLLGVGNQVILSNLQTPVTMALNSLSTLFAIIIGIDVFVLTVLGTLEAVIERITGDSATFENGKMITLRRQELIERHARERVHANPRSRSEKSITTSGPPSVYNFPFPVPEPPGREAVTRSPNIIITTEEDEPGQSASNPTRQAPAIVSGNVAEKLPAITSGSEARTATPRQSPFAAGQSRQLPSPSTETNKLSTPQGSGIPTGTPPQKTSFAVGPEVRPAVGPSSISQRLPAQSRTPLDEESEADEDVNQQDGEDEDLSYEDFEDPA